MSPKPIVVFDATILAVGNIKDGARSGIFWVSWNLFKEFVRSDKFTLQLYCQPTQYTELIEFLREQFPHKRFNFINQAEMGKFTILYSKMRARKEQAKRNGRALHKNMYHLLATGCRVFSTVEKIQAKTWTRQLKSALFFFSPVYAAPEVFKNEPCLTRVFMLYDAMPVLFPHFFPNGCTWFMELVHSMNNKDLYFTDSHSARQDFLKVAPQIPPEHITTAYIASNQPYQPERDAEKLKKVKEKYNIPQDKTYIFSLCTLEIRKNIPFAIDNFIRFCEKNHITDQILVLGGSFQDKRLDKYKKSPYVKFIGYVDDEDLQTLYSAAYAFVYPSLYEGFGMPILEAMSCGCPVICSNTSSMPEVIGDCGILIDPTQGQTLVEAFERMHTDKGIQQSCREKGLARANQFSWAKCMQVIADKLLAHLNAAQ